VEHHTIGVYIHYLQSATFSEPESSGIYESQDRLVFQIVTALEESLDFSLGEDGRELAFSSLRIEFVPADIGPLEKSVEKQL
jgi:hypothetical protein